MGSYCELELLKKAEVYPRMAATTSEPTSSTHDADRIDSKPALNHATTNISISPELFEKLYLQPKLAHTSENVKKYANATPLGFLGYAITFSLRTNVLGGTEQG